MKTLFTLALLSAAILLGGCSNAEKYAANQAATSSWLKSSGGRPDMRISGAWEALETGWGGAGRFVQTGNQITGALGNYTVRGVVNGTTAYLAFESSGWTYYTAVLKKRGNTLGGFYSGEVPFSARDQGSLTLRKLAD